MVEMGLMSGRVLKSAESQEIIKLVRPSKAHLCHDHEHRFGLMTLCHLRFTGAVMRTSVIVYLIVPQL